MAYALTGKTIADTYVYLLRINQQDSTLGEFNSAPYGVCSGAGGAWPLWANKEIIAIGNTQPSGTASPATLTVAQTSNTQGDVKCVSLRLDPNQYIGVTGDSDLLRLASGAFTVNGDATVTGSLTVNGISLLKGGTDSTITLGDTADDTVVFTAEVESNIVPNTDNTHDLGLVGQQWKDLYLDGTAYIDELKVEDATASTNATSGALVVTGGVGVGGSLEVGGNIHAIGNITADGSLTLGDDATDNIVFGADVDSNIIPDDDNTFDLGSTGQQWKDLWLNGVAYLDDVDIDGATFDAVMSAAISLDAGAGSNFSTSAGDLDISSAAELDLDGATVKLDSAGQMDVTAVGALNMASAALGITSTSFDINASGVVGIDSDAAMTIAGLSLDIDADGGAIEIDATTGISLDAGAASNFTTGAGDLDISAFAELDLDGATVKLDSAGQMDITSVAAMNLVSAAFDVNASGVIGVDSDAALTVGALSMGITADGGVGSGAIIIDTNDTTNGITIGSTASVPVKLGNAASEVTINDNLTVVGTTNIADLVSTDTACTFTANSISGNAIDGGNISGVSSIDTALLTSAGDGDINITPDGSGECVVSIMDVTGDFKAGTATNNPDTFFVDQSANQIGICSVIDANDEKLAVGGAIVVGDSAQGVSASTAGTIKFVGGTFEGYNGSGWIDLGLQPQSSAAGWTSDLGNPTGEIHSNYKLGLGMTPGAGSERLSVVGNITATGYLGTSFTGDSGSGGTEGIVPAPPAGSAEDNKFLRADGTWKTAVDASGAAVNGDILQRDVVIAAASFVGTGVNDMTTSGTFTGLTPKVYKVQIDVQALTLAINVANNIKSKYNQHGADFSDHSSGIDNVNIINAADSTDLATLITLVTEIIDEYEDHQQDSALGSGWAFHVAQEATSHALASNTPPTNLDECITQLLDIRTKFNAHDADSTTHGVGGNYAVSAPAAITADTFKWSENNGSSYPTTGVAITQGVAQTLSDGVQVTFADGVSHVLADEWTANVTAEWDPISVATVNAAYATIDNPTFTTGQAGIKAAADDDSTQLATTSWVQDEIDKQGAPALLNTITLLAAAINDDPAFSNGTSLVKFGGIGLGTAGVSGEVRATGDIYSNYSSDIRLKENINNIKDPLDKLCNLNGVMFDWTDDHMESRGGEDGYFVSKHNVGILAHEVQEILPEIVKERESGYLAVEYDKLIPLLIEAVKELKGRLDAKTD